MIELKGYDLNSVEFLREYREIICFSVINRGLLWYNTLSEEQLTELDVWYKAWLNITTTKVIPQEPKWLNEEVK
jgi:hypothetical protein